MAFTLPDAIRPAWTGLAMGGVFYVLGLSMHGELRAERGCVIDTPWYEIVNGPAMLLSAAGVPIRPEGLGEAPPVDRETPSGPTFDRTTLLTSGLIGWGGLGAAIGFGVGRWRTRAIAGSSPRR